MTHHILRAFAFMFDGLAFASIVRLIENALGIGLL